jgi:hypothetical protein
MKGSSVARACWVDTTLSPFPDEVIRLINRCTCKTSRKSSKSCARAGTFQDGTDIKNQTKVVRANSNSPQLSDALMHEGVNIWANLTGSAAINPSLFPKEGGSTIANDHKGGGEEHREICSGKLQFQVTPRACLISAACQSQLRRRAVPGRSRSWTPSPPFSKSRQTRLQLTGRLPPLASQQYPKGTTTDLINSFENFLLRLDGQNLAPRDSK